MMLARELGVVGCWIAMEVVAVKETGMTQSSTISNTTKARIPRRIQDKARWRMIRARSGPLMMISSAWSFETALVSLDVLLAGIGPINHASVRRSLPQRSREAFPDRPAPLRRH